MLTLKKCKEKLEKSKKTYSDEEVQVIRDYLYKLASINVDFIKEKTKRNEQKGSIVHKGVD
ncbi:MAG: hypothetical protein NTW49_12280 [Bacteroidia bacterium]|nr:hypothetical protein [Bacteroidia bacterium]